MSDNLAPTAQAILDHLHDLPPTSAADLREPTGRSRSAIDKALSELAKTGLVTKSPSDGDGPTLWVLADLGAAGGPPTDAADLAESSGANPDLTEDDPSQEDPPVQGSTDETDSADLRTGAADDIPAGAGPLQAPVTDENNEPVEEVKVCRSCGEQMPKICQTCWQKTTSYCGSCRRTQPTRRRTPGEPQVLANGLPKLTPGELQRLVGDVIRTQPLPDHLGITGWTSGRVAIFLPGRSTGAIGNALERLAATGQAQLIGDNPKRYQPTPSDDSAADEPDVTSEPDELQ